jgi:transposase-like protein
MSPRKLTAADKKAIVSTYRSSGESMSVLAARYGVSNSTVSRLLKNNIPELEYEAVSAEQQSPTGESFHEEATLLELPPGPEDITLDEATMEDLPEQDARRRVRRRSSAPEKSAIATPRPVTKAQKAAELLEPEPVEAPVAPAPTAAAWPPPNLLQAVAQSGNATDIPAPSEPEESVGLFAVAGILDEDMGDLLEDEEDDFGEEDGWSEMSEPSLIAIADPRRDVQPLSAANLPRTCYIVVDRFAELVACPLDQFAELGSATAEATKNTLPVFDNHRVAKRFSSERNQRVIKVPDSRIFQKTTRQLAAKGINLLLVDGQVYSLN